MERSELLELMTSLQLLGMKAAYDDIVTAGVKRQHGVEKVIGALLKAEIAAKQALRILAPLVSSGPGRREAHHR